MYINNTKNSLIAYTYAYCTVSGSVWVSSYGLYDTCCTFVHYFGMNYSKKGVLFSQSCSCEYGQKLNAEWITDTGQYQQYSISL